MELSKHYRVEALVRLSEGRMFYLVTDERPDQPTRKCWECLRGEFAHKKASMSWCREEMGHTGPDWHLDAREEGRADDPKTCSADNRPCR